MSGIREDRKDISRQRYSARDRKESANEYSGSSRKGDTNYHRDRKNNGDRTQNYPTKSKNEKHVEERQGREIDEKRKERIDHGKRTRSRTPTDRHRPKRSGEEGQHNKRPRLDDAKITISKSNRRDEDKAARRFDESQPRSKSTTKTDHFVASESTRHRGPKTSNRRTMEEKGRDHRRSNEESATKISVSRGDDQEAFANLGFNDPAFANLGFSTLSSNNLFENSVFANKDFSSTAKTRQNEGRRSTWTSGSSSKPKILPPREPDTGYIAKHQDQIQPKQNTFKITVNELSEVSIKREEHPMKGTSKSSRRPSRGGMTFSAQRGSRGTSGFIQHRGMGIRVGTNQVVRNHQKTIDGFGDGVGTYAQRRPEQYQNQRQARSASPPAAIDKSVQSSVIVVNPNPLAVPRGRNYFLHDARDDFARIPPADTHRLYDPRLDRANRGIERRGGGYRGRGIGGGRVGIGRGGGHGQQTDPPLGWRDQKADDTSNISFHGRRGRGRGTNQWTGSEGYGGAEASLTGRPYWRSKADEDRVWSHDKFFEEEQEEAATGMKLELVDEVVGGKDQQEVAGEKFDWTGRTTAVTFGTYGGDQGQGRDVKMGEKSMFIDDTEELVYD